MSRTASQRVADVRRLVDAARAVAGDARLAERLVETTGLSRQGVDLALADHLETSPDDADLERLVESAGSAERVHVVLSSNVFVGALRALAIARACAERVTVAPSRREPMFAKALVERAAVPGLSIEPGLPVESVQSGEIHVYGRDETLVDVRAHAAKGVRVRGHGSGIGVAVVTRSAGLADTARAMARDVAPFDQRGCLSPRLMLVLGLAESKAVELCVELDHALAAFEERVPRGILDPEEMAAAARYLSTAAFAGPVWRGKAHAVGLGAKGAPLLLPPSGRHLHVAMADGVDEARALLVPLARFVAAVGSDAHGVGADLIGHRARVSPLGQMQRPPLDGPVDMRES